MVMQDQVVPSTFLLEAKDFLIRNNVEVETLLIKNCDHHIPIEASSTALNLYSKKNIIKFLFIDKNFLSKLKILYE